METSETDKHLGGREKNTFILSILSFIVAVISMFIALYAVDKNEQIAERSGAFDKGELNLSFEGYIVDPKKTYELYFGIQARDSTMYYTKIPTGVYNSGKKTIDNIELLIYYPPKLNLTVPDSAYTSKDTKEEKNFDRRVIKSEPYDQVLMTVKSLNPKFRTDVRDLFYIGEQFPKFKASYHNDSSEITIAPELSFFDAFATLSAKDIQAQLYQFEVSLLDESNVDTLIYWIVSEKLKKINRAKILQPFFIIVPKIRQKDVVVGRGKIETYDSIATDVLLCQFDNYLQNLFILDRNGSVTKKIAIKTVTAVAPHIEIKISESPI